MKLHPRLTEDVILEAVHRGMFGLDSPGLCIACGAEQDGVEPDARQYKCQACECRTVYGAEEIAMETIL